MSAAFREYCQRPSPRLDRNIVSSMLDLMPAAGLIFNEWDKHGTCSGLGARAYFEAIRKARAAVKIPEQFLDLVGAENHRARRHRGGLRQGQSGLEQFGDLGDLRRAGACSEVRICMSKDMQFRACEEIDRRACRRDEVVMPPVRGS